MTEEERIHRASLAAQILGNEAFVEATNRLANHYINAWKAAQTVEAREDCHRYMKVCSQFARDLEAMVTDGQIVQSRLRELEGKSRKRWGVV